MAGQRARDADADARQAGGGVVSSLLAVRPGLPLC